MRIPSKQCPEPEGIIIIMTKLSNTILQVLHLFYKVSLHFCLLSFLCNPYIPFLIIYKNFHLLVSFHFFTAFSSESYRT